MGPILTVRNLGYRSEAAMANKQQAIMSLFRMQSVGISENQILVVDRYLQEISNGQQYSRIVPAGGPQHPNIKS